MSSQSLGTDGSLRVHLAGSEDEVRAAQALRYRIFYTEMGAQPTEASLREGRDVDRFDEICDHLLVTDLPPGASEPVVVGNYRMLRRSVAEHRGGFYSEDEFDLEAIKDYPGEVLEVGRSCVDPNYRGRAVMQMLWQGIASYVYQHGIGLLFGCASLPGTDPTTMKRPLSFLFHNYLAPSHLLPRAVPSRYVPMNHIPAEGIDAAAAWRELPPLVRGYLRLGGRVGDGAVVDHRFNTTDVCVVLETEQVTARYLRHYQQTMDQPTA